MPIEGVLSQYRYFDHYEPILIVFQLFIPILICLLKQIPIYRYLVGVSVYIPGYLYWYLVYNRYTQYRSNPTERPNSELSKPELISEPTLVSLSFIYSLSKQKTSILII